MDKENYTPQENLDKNEVFETDEYLQMQDIPTADEIQVETDAPQEQEEDLKPSRFSLTFSKLKAVITDKKNRPTVMIASVAIVVILAVLFVSLYINSDRVSNSLDPSKYDVVQVDVYMAVESSEQEDPEETDNHDYETSHLYDNEGNPVYFDSMTGEYYYFDGDGEMVYVEEDQIQQEEENSLVKTNTMKKNGDTYLISNTETDSYMYSRDGKKYLLYYDDFYGIYEEGEWIEKEIGDFKSYLTFDFDVLGEIKASDLKKTKEGYVPKGNAHEFYCNLLKIYHTEDYSDCEVYIDIEKGKITQIRTFSMHYSDYGISEVQQVFYFTYDVEKIEVPEADRVEEEV